MSGHHRWSDIRDARRAERAEATAVTAMGHPGVPPGGARALMQCAAIASGCTSALVLPLDRTPEPGDPIARILNQNWRAAEMLKLNGWRVDHGRWVCGLHERRPCDCPPGSAAARSGGACSGEDWCEHCP